MSVAGRRAVVTGAGGALGAAVVAALHEAGAQVGALYRTTRGELPTGVPAVGADLTDEQAVGAACEQMRRSLGGHIEILVHCAGGFRSADLSETSLETWRGQIDGNLTAAFLALRAVLPDMLAAGWGRIVTVGSRASLSGSAGVAAYSASKGGLLRLTEAVAAEGLERAVTANCVLPGTIDTAANRRSMPEGDAAAWVAPAAIAQVCLFLCSEAAGCISGAALPVYGRS